MVTVFSWAHPIVWVTGKALLAGTFLAHWVDVMTAARFSQLVKDSLSFFGWNTEVCRLNTSRNYVLVFAEAAGPISSTNGQ